MIDATGKHAPFGYIACGVQVIASIVLLCWDMVSMQAKMAAYCKHKSLVFMMGTSYFVRAWEPQAD